MQKNADGKKKKQKDSQLLIRLNSELRQRFVDLCAELDTSAAREVRHFIRRYLKEHENQSPRKQQKENWEMNKKAKSLKKDIKERKAKIEKHMAKLRKLKKAFKKASWAKASWTELLFINTSRTKPGTQVTGLFFSYMQ